ncbi:MAG TPA: aldo/keto reductase [Clostridia bacterium]|nr:aldo/keto reductase [Clostridia bacterium]
MLKDINSCVRLHNGVQMPWLGFGTFKIPDGEEVEQSVLWALEAGYRSIDTAAMYRNEAGVGRALKASGIPRDQIFLTTKVANDDQGYESTLQAFEKSLELLEVDYVDLYLVHRAVKGKFPDTWRAMETIYQGRRARAVGVSNFLIHHLETLRETSDFIPMVNQIEYHPLLTEVKLLQYCAQRDIVPTAWSPLMRGGIFENEVIQQLAQKYKKTMAQVVLRWDLQHGVVTIPKSVHRERIVENANLFDFNLSDEDMALIDALNQDHRISTHPDNY